MPNIIRRIPALAALLMLISTASAQPETATRDFDIAAQPAAAALNEFARQADITLVFSYELVSSAKTNALKGNYSVKAALTRMLDGTHLVYRQLDGGTVAISKKTDKMSSAEALPQLAQAEVPAQPGQASETEQTDNSPVSTKKQDEQGTLQSPQEVIVTGTHIRGAAPVGANVSVITKADIDRTGFATVQDVLQTIPQSFASAQNEVFNQISGNFSKGTGINLRGLGIEGTLTLINGRRAPVSGSNGDFVDVDSIPASAIDRIEIMTDGASALYGSDAIGGVVNIILKKHHDGAHTEVRFGSAEGDSSETRASQTLGHSWGNASVFGGYQYYHRTELLRGDRAITASYDKRPFGGTDRRLAFSNPANILCPPGGSCATLQPVYSVPTGQDGTHLTVGQLSATPNLSSASAEFQDLLPENTTHSGFLSATYALAPSTQMFVDGRYSDRRFTAKSNPLVANLNVPSTNAFFVNPFASIRPTSVFVGYDFIDDYGPITVDGNAKTLASDIGVRHDFSQTWSITASAGYGKEQTSWITLNQPNQTLLAAALADSNPQTAFNPFGDGSHTSRDTLERLRLTADAAASNPLYTSNYFDSTRSDVSTVNIVADGVLAELPQGPLRMAIGADHRREALESTRDTATLARNVSAAFAELNVPIVRDSVTAGSSMLEASLAGRYERYSDFGDTFNPRVGLRFAPIRALNLRGTWGKSFRAPKLIDLDEAANGGIPSVRISQFSLPSGGTTLGLLRAGNNRNLNQETASLWTTGFDLAPGAGSSLSVTYYSIDYHDRIISPGEALSTDTLLQESRWAAIISRDPTQISALCSGPISNSTCAANPPTVIVDGRLRNTSGLRTSGFDVTLKHRFETELGILDFGLTGNKTLHFRQTLSPASPEVELLDRRGFPVSMRARGLVNWSYRRASVNAAINYTGDYTDDGNIPNRHIASWTTFDVGMGYRIAARSGWLNNTEFALRAVNVLGRDPPFVDSTLGIDSYNSSPQGRLVSLTVQKSW